MNNKILIGSIIAIAILIGVSFTSVVGYRSRFDSVWKDDFDNNSRADLINCFIKDGYVSMNRLKNYIEFDFTDFGAHEAYSYIAYNFRKYYPPNLHIFREYKLKEHTDEINNIKRYDGKVYTTSTNGAKKYVVHHFKFKIDFEPENIDRLGIYWIGNAENHEEIKFYYWKYFPNFMNLGEWVIIGKTTSNYYITFDTTIFDDNILHSLKNDNCIDISFVGISDNEGCNLSTDYVSIFCITGIFHPV